MMPISIELRPIGPDDAVELAAFHERLSPESQYLRFFSAHPRLSDRERHRFTQVDQHDRVGIVAVLGTRIVGWAEYERIGHSAQAELAVVVEDGFQQHGVGTRLITSLLARAAENGLERLVAETLPENIKARTLLRESGAPCRGTYHDGLLRIDLAVPRTTSGRRSHAVGPCATSGAAASTSG